MRGFIALLAALALLLSCTPKQGTTLLSPPTPTPTATSTPAPTATPTATATPSPTATPIPLRVSLELEPNPVAQGHVLLVKVQSNRAVEVKGSFQGKPLVFAFERGFYWSLVGIAPDSPPVPRGLQVTARDASGEEMSLEAQVEVAAYEFRVERIYLPPSRLPLLESEVVLRERALLAEVFSRFEAKRLWEDTFALPLEGEVTSPFGARRSWQGGPVGGPHEGVDLDANLGDPVVASASGRVALAQELEVRGRAVILSQGMGVFSGYYHLSEIKVGEGQAVSKGEVLGYVGETGLATGPHLHWEVRVGEVFVEPWEWTRRLLPG